MCIYIYIYIYTIGLHLRQQPSPSSTRTRVASINSFITRRLPRSSNGLLWMGASTQRVRISMNKTLSMAYIDDWTTWMNYMNKLQEWSCKTLTYSCTHSSNSKITYALPWRSWELNDRELNDETVAYQSWEQEIVTRLKRTLEIVSILTGR